MHLHRKTCIAHTYNSINLHINSCVPTSKKDFLSHTFLYGMETKILIHLFKECSENFNVGSLVRFKLWCCVMASNVFVY